MNRKVIFFVILTLIVISIAILVLRPKQPVGSVISTVQIADDGSLEVYFCPQDNCSGHLIAFINNAQSSLDCALFDLNLQSVSDALDKKSQSIPVRVVFDNTNKAHIDKLHPLFSYRYDNDNQLSHNKFCAADGKYVFTGSMNPTLRDDKFNNNNIIIFSSQHLAQNYAEEFSEIWAGQFGKGNPVTYPSVTLSGIFVENYFCPEDHCEKHVVEHIQNAKHSVYFMTFSFTSEQIGDALLANKHIEIKGIFEKSQDSKYSQYERLKGFELAVRFDANKYNLHDKIFIIDNETVITGSYNPTTHGDEHNDENMLIIHDRKIAQKYVEEFMSLYTS